MESIVPKSTGVSVVGVKSFGYGFLDHDERDIVESGGKNMGIVQTSSSMLEDMRCLKRDV